jgi:hypothetical protein
MCTFVLHCCCHRRFLPFAMWGIASLALFNAQALNSGSFTEHFFTNSAESSQYQEIMSRATGLEANTRWTGQEILNVLQNLKFIAVFTKIRHCSPSLATWIHSIPFKYSFNFRVLWLNCWVHTSCRPFVLCEMPILSWRYVAIWKCVGVREELCACSLSP